MTQKTAIQEAIEKVQDQIKMIKGFKQSALERKEDDTKYQLAIQELQLVVNSILTPLLPKECQDLIDAHADGIEDGYYFDSPQEGGEQYVHEKFGI